ncbi:hypothetical protein EYF80_047867 [Liparis tanakae]|uniref:Uncharacterized protein n=1 Tax=Liparis tanakae TaxID=230148 RepID=A0A4Z2FMH7_9TELE|nr:hypothetical protein EYF80_047867 [Liparis tanakae]
MHRNRLLLGAPAHGGAGGEPEDVGLLGGEAGDGELPRVGPHLHRGPPPGVPAVQAESGSELNACRAPGNQVVAM